MRQYLKEFKEAHNLSLQEIAAIMGVTKTTVNRYLLGIIATIPEDRVKLLREYHDDTVSKLLLFKDKWSDENV